MPEPSLTSATRSPSQPASTTTHTPITSTKAYIDNTLVAHIRWADDGCTDRDRSQRRVHPDAPGSGRSRGILSGGVTSTSTFRVEMEVRWLWTRATPSHGLSVQFLDDVALYSPVRRLHPGPGPRVQSLICISVRTIKDTFPWGLPSYLLIPHDGGYFVRGHSQAL
jgi:hypothetical protein